MNSVLPSITLFCLLMTSIALANTEVKKVPNPADNLDKSEVKNNSTTTKDEKITPSQSRGQLLYEHHCLKCHESNIHIRNKRKARTLEDVQAWIIKWQTHEKLDWGKAEIDAVSEFLLDQYYKFK